MVALTGSDEHIMSQKVLNGALGVQFVASFREIRGAWWWRDSRQKGKAKIKTLYDAGH